MALYVTLYNFTDQGIRAVKESPARLQAAIKAGATNGVKVVGAYYTQGPYDLVVISEADNEDAAAGFALNVAAQGNVRSLSMRAWDPESFGKITARVS
ncbi:MAG TPA: GYD domain-containing protein [Longimicrobiales bacterium]|nr:GYD domain-containing protein [Longimicrobiales bacterium]